MFKALKHGKEGEQMSFIDKKTKTQNERDGMQSKIPAERAFQGEHQESEAFESD